MRKHLWLAIACMSALAACGGGSGDEPQAQYGKVSLGVTDAAVDGAQHVVVEFTGVEIKAVNDSSPEVFDFAAPRQIDLLALEGGGSEILLRDELLPAGDYEWMRLKVNAGRTASDSYVDLKDGSRHALFIPSGNQSGLKLIRGFTVGAGSTTNFTIDFDLRRSVLRPPGQNGDFVLKPVLRVVNNLQVGTLTGVVAQTLIGTPCTPAVYAFTGADIVADDLAGTTEPFVTARVLQSTTTGAYGYRIGYMPVGTYSLAFTCEANLDDPETNDTIAFVKSRNATVVVGQTTTANFD
jgi:Domain of unknown function (DUF4382)